MTENGTQPKITHHVTQRRLVIRKCHFPITFTGTGCSLKQF